MTIYEVHGDDGGSIVFKATKAQAVAERKWWRDRGNDVDFRPIRFKPTREGIAALLSTFAGGAG